MSKESFIRGTLILTLAAFIARFLGFAQRIPLKHLLGDSGMGSYTISYNMYFMLFTIATAGLPSAVSKLISEKNELGRKAEAEMIFRAASWFAVISGLIMMIAMFVLAPVQARISGDLNAVLPLRAIAPALLLFPLAAIIRGYFQGRQQMLPNGLSQIVEQILRVVTSVLLAYTLQKVGWGAVWEVSGASFGGVTGTIGAILVLWYYLEKIRRGDRSLQLEAPNGSVKPPALSSYSHIYKTLLLTAFPIVLYSITVPVINYIDTSIIKPLLTHQVGEQAAQNILGQLGGRAQSLAGLPLILAVAISQSIVPIISSAYSKKDTDLVKLQSGKALRLAILTGLPLVLLICAGARPINSLAFEDVAGTDLIVGLTAITMFQIIMQTSGAILMGLGAMKKLVQHVLVGLASKLVLSFALAPFLGIYGILLGTACCFIVMLILNHYALKRLISGYNIFESRQWGGLLLSAAILAGLGAAVERGCRIYISGLNNYADYFLQTCIVSLVVLILYPLPLGALRVVTGADIQSYPPRMQRLIFKIASPFRRGLKGSRRL